MPLHTVSPGLIQTNKSVEWNESGSLLTSIFPNHGPARLQVLALLIPMKFLTALPRDCGAWGLMIRKWPSLCCVQHTEFAWLHGGSQTDQSLTLLSLLSSVSYSCLVRDVSDAASCLFTELQHPACLWGAWITASTLRAAGTFPLLMRYNCCSCEPLCTQETLPLFKFHQSFLERKCATIKFTMFKNSFIGGKLNRPKHQCEWEGARGHCTPCPD